MPETAEPIFAPETRTPPMASGANQTGVRVYNERLLLSLVRRFGQLSKIEVARMTGLSVQSTSAIMNRLQQVGDKPRPKTLFEPGEMVRVNDGPFADFNGVVEEVDYE